MARCRSHTAQCTTDPETRYSVSHASTSSAIKCDHSNKHLLYRVVWRPDGSMQVQKLGHSQCSFSSDIQGPDSSYSLVFDHEPPWGTAYTAVQRPLWVGGSGWSGNQGWGSSLIPGLPLTSSVPWSCPERSGSPFLPLDQHWRKHPVMFQALCSAVCSAGFWVWLRLFLY